MTLNISPEKPDKLWIAREYRPEGGCMSNLIVRKLKVPIVVVALLLTACDEIKDDVKEALISTGWLHLDGEKPALNVNLAKAANGGKFVTVNNKLYAVWNEQSHYIAEGGYLYKWDISPTRVAVLRRHGLFLMVMILSLV